MARKVVSAKTIEERRTEVEQLQASIAQQVEQLRSSESWEQYLRFAQAFHNYSFNNLMLILSQNPLATQVAGYRTWQSRGRQVRKGERGLRIFGGRRVTATVEDETTGEEAEVSRMRFFPVSVFDVGQTEPVEGKELPADQIVQLLTGTDELGIFDAVVDYLTGLGWTVTREEISGGANGYTTTDGTKKVVVEAALAPAQAAKTALHEAAHVLLHVDENPAEYVAHRGIIETEAESVAYVVAGVLGLDTQAYSIGYVAGWSQCETEVIKSTGQRVLKAAHQLVAALTTKADANAADANAAA